MNIEYLFTKSEINTDKETCLRINVRDGVEEERISEWNIPARPVYSETIEAASKLVS